VSGFRVAFYAVGILWIAFFWLASSVDFVPARIVDQAALPLSFLLGLVAAVLLPLHQFKWRAIVCLGATGIFVPMLGLVVPVASTYVFTEPTTIALKVTDKYHTDGRDGHCNGFRFDSRPDLMVHRVCVPAEVWRSAGVGDQLAAKGVRNGLGFRVQKWEKLGQ